MVLFLTFFIVTDPLAMLFIVFKVSGPQSCPDSRLKIHLPSITPSIDSPLALISPV